VNLARWVVAALAVVALPPAVLAWAAMAGLGLHRHAAGWTVAVAATFLVYAPAAVAAAAAPRHRGAVLLGVLGTWSTALLLLLPVYFPGERQQAVATGIAAIVRGDGGERVARDVASRLPAEPTVSEPEVPAATAMVEAQAPPAAPLRDDEIALPYEGEGRRLAVPVTFENQGRTVDTWMLLDTGATYTTLPSDVLAKLGLYPGKEDPEITLHTANGERQARLMLADKAWLGDLSIDGVAVATCDECAGPDTVGLLGLNVTGGYNLLIDADRREAVFTTRAEHDRRIDVGPFVDLSASFLRYPGGRVEVSVKLHNDAPYAVSRAEAAIACGDDTWIIGLTPVDPGTTGDVRRKLPPHDPCPDGYRLSLQHASW